MQNFIKKYPEFCALSMLAILCSIFLFFGIDLYPILDTTESLFASVAKNIITHDTDFLVLNMQPFLEKPPLYFWLIAQSIKLFNTFNEFSIRLPNAIISFIFVFATYFMGKHIHSRKFGFCSAVIMLTSFAYLILSHMAVLNIAFVFFTSCALYFAFLTSTLEENSKNKKCYWWLFYIFCGLACLVKGFIGIILPFSVVLAYFAITKNLKEVFKPLNLIIGLLFFIPMVLPWYYEMSSLFGEKFIKNYLYIPHITNSLKDFIYYNLVFLLAFMPWTLLFFGYIINVVKKAILRIQNNNVLKLITVEQKLSLFALLHFVITLIIISFIERSVFLILLLIPPASILTAYFLCATDINEFFKKKVLSFSSYTLALIFTVGTISFAFLYMFLPLNIFEQVQQFKNCLIIGLNFLSILLLLKLKNKNVLSVLSTYIFSMLFIIIFVVVHGFNMFYFSGENELVRFTQYATNKDTKLITYNLPVKPSILMEASDYVYFINERQIKKLNDLIKENGETPCYIIMRNKDIKQVSNKLNTAIYPIDNGDKYSIFSNINIPKKAISLSKFYNEK